MRAARLSVDVVDAPARTATLSGDLSELRAVACSLGGGVVVMPAPNSKPVTVLERTAAVLLAVARLDLQPISIRVTSDDPLEVLVNDGDLLGWAERCDRLLDQEPRDSEHYPVQLLVELDWVRVVALTTRAKVEKAGRLVRSAS